MSEASGHLVITIGAGPAGIYGVRKLAEAGHEVILLNRDIIFIATGDEEEGGRNGAGWLVAHEKQVFADAGYLLNEGGGIEQTPGHRLLDFADQREFVGLVFGQETGDGFDIGDGWQFFDLLLQSEGLLAIGVLEAAFFDLVGKATRNPFCGAVQYLPRYIAQQDREPVPNQLLGDATAHCARAYDGDRFRGRWIGGLSH